MCLCAIPRRASPLDGCQLLPGGCHSMRRCILLCIAANGWRVAASRTPQPTRKLNKVEAVGDYDSRKNVPWETGHRRLIRRGMRLGFPTGRWKVSSIPVSRAEPVGSDPRRLRGGMPETSPTAMSRVPAVGTGRARTGRQPRPYRGCHCRGRHGPRDLGMISSVGKEGPYMPEALPSTATAGRDDGSSVSGIEPIFSRRI